MASSPNADLIKIMVERKRKRLESFLSGVGILYPKLIKVYREGLTHEEMSIKLATASQVKDLIKAQIPREEKHEHSGHIGTGDRPIEHMTPDEIEAEIAAINRELERRAAAGTDATAKAHRRKTTVGKRKRQPD